VDDNNCYCPVNQPDTDFTSFPIVKTIISPAERKAIEYLYSLFKANAMLLYILPVLAVIPLKIHQLHPFRF